MTDEYWENVVCIAHLIVEFLDYVSLIFHIIQPGILFSLIFFLCSIHYLTQINLLLLVILLLSLMSCWITERGHEMKVNFWSL